MAKTLRNTVFSAVFTDISGEGFGVCRAPDGRTLFAAGALPGEEATVKIIKEYKSYLIGRVEQLTKPSPHRAESDCAAYPRCGGCSFRHVDYQTELEYKRAFVKQTFLRNAGMDMEVQLPLSGDQYAYRNKLLLPVTEKDGALYCGFYARHSHTVIPCDNCRLHTEDFGAICKSLLELLKGQTAYNEETGNGLIRHLYLRRTRQGEFGVCLIINGNTVKGIDSMAESLMAQYPQIKSFYLNINTTRGNTVTGDTWRLIKGAATLTDTICGKHFTLSPASFFQVNASMTDVLYTEAARLADIQPGDTVFDMYCGAGTVGLCLCPADAYLCGVEIVPQAVENAKLNAALNGRSAENTRFICGDAAEGFAACKAAFGRTPNVVLVDPPRAGLAPTLIDDIAAEAPEKVVYISCNPATLARDAARFAAHGYKTDKAVLVDMFPRTTHVESVVLLERTDSAI